MQNKLSTSWKFSKFSIFAPLWVNTFLLVFEYFGQKIFKIAKNGRQLAKTDPKLHLRENSWKRKFRKLDWRKRWKFWIWKGVVLYPLRNRRHHYFDIRHFGSLLNYNILSMQASIDSEGICFAVFTWYLKNKMLVFFENCT